MSHLDRSRNVLEARVLLWGPAGSGKTAVLSALRRLVDPEGKLRLYRIAGLFDVLPLEDFTYGSFRVRGRVMAVSRDTAMWDPLVRSTDVVLFVADSRRSAEMENSASLRELADAMKRHGLDVNSVPTVFCCNRRDARDAMPLDEMGALLADAKPHEVVARTGQGVFECFTEAFRLLMETIGGRHDIVGPDTAAATPARLLPQLARGGKVNFERPSGADDRTLVIELPEEGTPAVDAMIRLAEAHVESDHLNVVLDGRNRELMAINRVARSILSAMEPDNLLVVLLDAIADYIGVTHASCVMFDPTEEGKLRSHVHGFGRDPVLGLRHKEARYLFDLLQSSDGPIPVSDQHNPQLLQALRRVDRRVQRALFQAIRGNSGRAAGWLGIYTTAEEAPLTTQRLLFLSSISRLAALGLEKIAMVEETRVLALDMEVKVADSTAKLEMAKARMRALNRGMESRVTERTRSLESSVREMREKRAVAMHEARLEGAADVAATFAGQVRDSVAQLGQGLGLLRERLDELRAQLAQSGGLEGVDDFDAILEETNAHAEKIAGVVGSLQRLGTAGDLDDVDLNAAVADALTMLDDRVQATVDVELRLGTLPMVRGNARELGHVVLALITNAVEAIERKGARSRLVLSTFATPDQVTLLVQDTGCGIDEALQPRIFEPFFTTKDDEKAAGLGLHIAREAVKRHGGAISVRSKPGEGTAAKVTLAVSAAVSADADADASSHAAQ